VHDKRYPNETPAYRDARNALLNAELDLRKRVEDVAALRRKLPLGGEIPEDYVFHDLSAKKVKLSKLFGKKDTLLLYSWMFAPKSKKPCPLCTSILDGWEGTAPHVTQRAALAVVGRASPKKLKALAKSRGWKNLRIVSSEKNDYNAHYLGERSPEEQYPMLNVFVRRDKAIHHFWGSELLFVKTGEGVDSRHVDQFWPLWHLLDTTPEGRGDFYPKLEY
jgi:predicted dithiol-disulfide oxidoreductase (DUF899 family)